MPEAISAAGMTPPKAFIPGRWLRFPGVGKGRSNRSGWCRIISETMAVFGDWSSDLRVVWKDDAHRDTADTQRLLEETRRREKRYQQEQAKRERDASEIAGGLIAKAIVASHPYLTRKGFPEMLGLVHEGDLLIPVRSLVNYQRIMSVQRISADGDKKFLTGGRTRGGIHVLGQPPGRAKRLLLCEGYATGLSLDLACKRLPGPHGVIVCFSANNLKLVAGELEFKATVAADSDASGTGEHIARETGLPWIMPANSDEDFNDLHQREGIFAVVNAIRGTQWHL